jgi:hypothetical protein
MSSMERKSESDNEIGLVGAELRKSPRGTTLAMVTRNAPAAASTDYVGADEGGGSKKGGSNGNGLCE